MKERTIGERIFQASLIFLILLSIYFSYNIWFNSKEKTIKESNNTVNQTLTDTPASQIFMPTFLVFHDEDSLNWTRGESIIEEIQKSLSKATFGVASIMEIDPKKGLNRQLNLDNALELRYEGQMLLKEYQRVFRLNLNLEKNGLNHFVFNRVIVDFSNTMIYFVNDEKSQAVRSVISLDMNVITHLRFNTKLGVTKVIENPYNTAMKYHYFVTEQVKLKKYSYIANAQSFTNFRDSFFENPTEVQSKDTSLPELAFAGEDNETMTIAEKSGALKFDGVFSSSRKTTFDNMYEQSYYYVKKLGNIFSTLRYFDSSNGTINYRMYFEGYPLFSKDYKGQVAVEINDNEKNITRVNIQTNIHTIQVPIPQDETVTLPDQEELMSICKNAGLDTKKISECLIGYEWDENSAKEEQVVNLTPTWFVKYKDKWLSQASIEKQATEGGGE